MNGTPLNSFLSGRRQVRITPLLKPGRNEVTITTHRVRESLTENDITFDIGGPAKYNARQEKFLIEPVVQFKAMQGWRHDQQTGQLVGPSAPDEEKIERTVAFVLEAAPQ